jgi:hypothetical protein
MNKPTEIIKFRCTIEQKEIMQEVYGPARKMSENILRTLLDPARINPKKNSELASRITIFENRLEQYLKASKPSRPEELPLFRACPERGGFPS